MLPRNTFKRVKCCPYGACLFIALRMGFEWNGIVDLLKQGRRDDRALNFNGLSHLAQDQGHLVRKLVCKFYSKPNWAHDTPFGTRRSILERELSKEVVDVTDADIERYVRDMEHSSEWGSTPEYLAFAIMAQASIKVYAGTHDLFLMDEVCLTDTDICLYFTGNHYDLLVRTDDAARVVEAYPVLVSLIEDMDGCT